MRVLWDSLVNFAAGALFDPPGRIYELFSMLAMVGWIYQVTINPQIFSRPAYSSFTGFGFKGWLAIFIVATAVHLFALLYNGRRRGDVRFLAMAIASGVWAFVGTNFLVTTISTTGTWTYLMMAAFAALIALRFAWTSSFYR